jgi:hypothetical protein
LAHNLTWFEVRTMLTAVGEIQEQYTGSWPITMAG